MNSQNNEHDPLHSLDNQTLNRFHWRLVITAGMGFFTDAYDLFVIGVVTTLLVPLWHLSTLQLAVLNASSLAAAALGAVLFGWCADRWGRKRMYGIELLILFIGALLSAVSPSFVWLLISRILVGIGIGGDYPTSAVVVSEHANKKNRGFLVLLVFAMQAIGLIVGPLLASLLIALHLSHEIVWRLLLGIGAIPAASVFYLRRQLSETPRFLLSKGLPVEVSSIVSELTGYKVGQAQVPAIQKLSSSPWLKYLIGTAGAWFLLDVAFYGNGVSSILVINSVIPHATFLQQTLVSALIFLCFAVPGYIFSAKYVDRIGRKPLQMMGFGVMAACYFAMAGIPNLIGIVPLFIGIFGLSFFFVNFGPNATTFLIPSEVFPTHIRAKGHGISAAVGKLGAFVGVFFLPLVLKHMGLSFTMFCIAIVCVLGIFISFLVPEMKNRSLESSEVYPP